MFDFSRIFNYNYIFEYIPQWNAKYGWINWAIYAGIIVFGFIFLLIAQFVKKNRFFFIKLKNQVLPLTNTIGIVGLVITFFRYQAIPYLSSRLLIYILGMVALIWLGWIAWYFIRNYPKEKSQYFEENRIKKYLKNKKVKRK